MSDSNVRLDAAYFTPPISAWASREEEAWAQFRGQRLADLHEPFGWLTLKSFQWLPQTAEPQPLPNVPGLWGTRTTAEGHLEAFLNPHDDAGFTSPDGAELERFSWVLTEGKSLMIAEHSGLRIELGLRGGRYMLRTRQQEPQRTSIDSFPYAARWVLSGVFEPAQAPYPESVATARPDASLTTLLVGTVRIDVPGAAFPVHLAAQDAGPGETGTHRLNLNFYDSTNGKSTAPWRFVTATVYGQPQTDETGQTNWAPGEYNVVVDFNRTLNYPMAFSDYAICPAPVLGNRIPAQVTAGERSLTRPI